MVLTFLRGDFLGWFQEMAFPAGPSHEKVYYGVVVAGRGRLSAEASASQRWGVGASALGRGRLSAGALERWGVGASALSRWRGAPRRRICLRRGCFEKRWLGRALSKDLARKGFESDWLRTALVERRFEQNMCEQGFRE